MDTLTYIILMFSVINLIITAVLFSTVRDLHAEIDRKKETDEIRADVSQLEDKLVDLIEGLGIKPKEEGDEVQADR